MESFTAWPSPLASGNVHHMPGFCRKFKSQLSPFSKTEMSRRSYGSCMAALDKKDEWANPINCQFIGCRAVDASCSTSCMLTGNKAGIGMTRIGKEGKALLIPVNEPLFPAWVNE